ncbi:protein stu1 [Niveomyces insectorum RCEF 264]|uniref:Protein stu1 n=1 Tax=Niveomyces insectorum RCEF 264 TaxID=1081102 RepID=A0A167PG43_9HYPO|nr:protein stu1 [Niveomyces insectorum RCEF 264]
MAEKVTIEQVNDLLTVLQRSDTPVDTKVQLVTATKSSIKQHNVPDNAVPVLFEALRAASASQNAALANAGFTGLNHLLTRLSRQEPKFLAKEAARTLPVLIDKLGDSKEKFRTLAQQALTTLCPAAPVDVERYVRNSAMAGKNARAKEAGMQWLLQMHQEQGLQFRAYVPVLMELLEDADGMVRDVAKTTVIGLFRTAPNAAKTDLKKQLKNFKVRPAIEQAIVKELAPTAASASASVATTAASSFSSTTTAADPIPRPASSRAVHRPPPSAGNSLAASVSSLAGGERPVTPTPEYAGRPDPVEPTYVNTQRELDDILKEMQVWFEGRESEQNWLKREESVTRLRRLIAGNAGDFADAFLVGVRAMLDGILKASNSLRTSLCKEGCSLIQDLANAFGPGIDPMVEILLQALIKLSAGTKKISSQLANAAVDAILGKATYNTRVMQHVWAACQDKNVQPRTYASGWLRTLLHKEAHHKDRIEHTGGLELIEKCIKKGLNDPNPGVRERMRSTYWVFAGLWPARAESIMTNLDGTAQRLLQNDPSNPNSPKRPENGTAGGGGGGGGSGGGGRSAAAMRPGLGLSKSTVESSASAKPSLRETMAARKKEAMASRNLPARPGSAMAHFSPVRTVSNSSAASNTSSSTTTTHATAAAATKPTTFGSRQRTEGGLSVAPVRPTKRRPELHPRPATAGPYSVRTHDHPSMEQSSPPETLRTRAAITPKTLAAGSPRRTAPRPRPGHQATASDSNLISPSRSAVGGPAAAKAVATASKPAPAPATSSTAAVATTTTTKTVTTASPRSSPSKPKSSGRIGQGGSPTTSRTAAPSAAVKPSAVRHGADDASGASHHHQHDRMASSSGIPTPTKLVPTVSVVSSDPNDVFEGRRTAIHHHGSNDNNDDDDDDDDVLGGGNAPLSPPLKVYEDPFSDEQSTPKPTASVFAPTALEDKPVNEDAGLLARVPDDDAAVAEAAAPATGGLRGATNNIDGAVAGDTTTRLDLVPGTAAGFYPPATSPEKAKQNLRLLDSGIAKIKAQTLDVHGFRKLQGVIRDAGNNNGGGADGVAAAPAAAAAAAATGTKPGAAATPFTDNRFDALLLGLFAYLEAPVPAGTADNTKAQDVKAQILATIKLLLKKARAILSFFSSLCIKTSRGPASTKRRNVGM